MNYANVLNSRTPAIINITSTTNVGVPGQWIYSASIEGMEQSKN